MHTLILARHGESTYSSRGLADGDPERRVPLSPKGREQARILGQKLADVAIDLCVTTEFLRTIETADIALSGRAVLRIVDPCFNDLVYGSFEGKPLSRYQDWQQEHSMSAVPPGSTESRTGTIRDYANGLRKLLNRKERVILLVAHEFTLTVILGAARGEAPTDQPAHIEPATPFQISGAEARQALTFLDRWLTQQVPRGGESKASS